MFGAGGARLRALRTTLAGVLLATAMIGAAQSQSTPAAQWQGRWLAEDIRGGGVVDRIQTYVEVAADGAVSGSGGCNRIFGQAKIGADKIAFGAMGATQMACPPAVMNQERKFLDALAAARGWRVDEARRKFVLLDADGKPLVVFARM